VRTLQQQFPAALAAHRRGEFDQAEAGYRAVLRAQPKHFDATQLLGALLHARGRNKEAQMLLRRAIALNPNLAAVHNNLGNVVRALGQPEESLAHFDRAIALDPGYADAFNNRANVLNDLGRRRDALADYDRALERNPDQANALQRSAAILADVGRFEEALARNGKAIALGPPSAELFRRSGNVLLRLDRPREALENFDKALERDPLDKRALIGRSAALELLDRPQEALENFDRGLAVWPDAADLLYNKATVLKTLKRIDEACAVYAQALAIAPDDPDANANFAMTLLLKGDFAAGWRAYEYRWGQVGRDAERPHLAAPAWNGEQLAGRNIVVYAEQGLGDIVQFSRYLPLLQARGADVALLAKPQMHALLRGAFPGVALYDDVAQVGAERFDFQCALTSLPLHFGTIAETIPSSVPYLKVDPEKVDHWRERIGTGGFRIGICWQGNPSVAIDVRRSMPLAQFAALASIPGVRLISLQKKDGLDQLERLDADMRVETLGEGFDSGADSFVDTMAAMECVDLVISPDTSIAHVAGALARPVWVALRHVPDWRWMLDRGDSPWYPTMRLFRQDMPGDWSGVFERMRRALITASG
jgi:tetratricopeptide (TPR) repeat protein